MSQTVLSDHERHLAAIAALQRAYDQAEAEWEVQRDVAAALKKECEAKARQLFEFIRALNKPLPLFEVWRQHPVADLGLPDGIVALLAEHGLDTVGKIADWTNAGKLLTDIPHVGANKAEAIKQALERFWREHPAPDGEAPPEDLPPEGD